MGITGIQLCGPLAVEVDGRAVASLPGRQGGLVVAYLALRRDRPVRRDELAAVIWPEQSPADPSEALAALLSKLRRALGRDVLEGRSELRLVFDDGVTTDWEDAFAAFAAGRPDAALAIADRGFLTGHDGPWIDDRRRELAELRADALERQLSTGAPSVAAARALVAAAPFRES